jgi:Family of unknown function (DUF5906)
MVDELDKGPGISAWANLEKEPRIEALIDATNAALDLGLQVYFEPHTGELLPREIAVDEETEEPIDRETGAPLVLLNRDNTPDRAAVQQIFDNEIVRDEDGSTVLDDYRGGMLLALATGQKSGVLALRMSAELYFMGVLDQLAISHDKPPLKPTTYTGPFGGYFNFFFKYPTGKTILKNIKVKIEGSADSDDIKDGDMVVMSDNVPWDFIGPQRPYEPTDADIEAERAAQNAARAATYESWARLSILGDGDMLLLPPSIGYWCDDMGNETSVVPEIPEMEPWLQTALGIKDQDDKKHSKPEKGGIRLKDFIAYLPQHLYIFIATREPWPASSVNARIAPFTLKNRDGTPKLNQKGKPIKMAASLWLDKNHAAAQMTWAPGEPLEVKDRLVADGGWFDHKGVTTFNLYRPPNIMHGDAGKVGPWLNHIRKVYPKDAEHILNWMAHRVQHPEIKINHALLLGGGQGIGKDTMLEPVKRAVGAWNFKEVSPSAMMERFNGFLKSVVLRINEVRDLGEISRYNFYEHMKPYITSPPDVLRVDEKNLKAHDIFNCCGIVMTTNHKLDGIYLPADDRRTYVAWSDFKKEDFTEAYWNEIWSFYDNGGDRNIAAWLAQRDISSFNPKAPPFKTDAWHAIVGSNIAPEESELSDALELLGNPNALILAWIETVARLVGGNLFAWLDDPKNHRAIPHKLASLGYTAVVNPDSAKRSTRWRINKVQQVVYAKDSLSERGRIEAVRAMPKKAPEPPPDPKDENSEQNQEVPF